jgi:hypothetical protein
VPSRPQLGTGGLVFAVLDASARAGASHVTAQADPGQLAEGSCQILDLTLGPLDLNLLGLVVHLDRVHLNITAVSGPGNLLGNLLCAVAHLLDSNASGTALARLLNRIFGLLG